MVAILPERYTKEKLNKTIPRTPNSNPLNGSTLKNPLMPRIPANPNAQEEQAGVRTQEIIQDKPIPAPYDSCLFTKKMLKEKTSPESNEMITKNEKETTDIVLCVLTMRSKMSSKEN